MPLLLQVDFGSGPPLMFAPYFLPIVHSIATILTASQEDGVYVYLDVPSEAVGDDSLQQILPNARYLTGK